MKAGQLEKEALAMLLPHPHPVVRQQREHEHSLRGLVIIERIAVGDVNSVTLDTNRLGDVLCPKLVRSCQSGANSNFVHIYPTT